VHRRRDGVNLGGPPGRRVPWTGPCQSRIALARALRGPLCRPAGSKGNDNPGIGESRGSHGVDAALIAATSLGRKQQGDLTNCAAVMAERREGTSGDSRAGNIWADVVETQRRSRPGLAMLEAIVQFEAAPPRDPRRRAVPLWSRAVRPPVRRKMTRARSSTCPLFRADVLVLRALWGGHQPRRHLGKKKKKWVRR